MGKEIRLTEDSTLIGTEFIRGISSDGKSVLIPIDVLQSYIQTNQRFALYDAATPDPGSVAFSKIFNTTSAKEFDLRLEFGPLTDESYWPGDYAGVLVNIDAAPAATVFDFLNLPLGTFVEFDVEFDLRFADESGNRLDLDFLFYMEFQYPNGSLERRTFKIPNDYIVTTAEIINNIKLSFSTYIKTALTDALRGGRIVYGIVDNLATSQLITVSDLIVRAKL